MLIQNANKQESRFKYLLKLNFKPQLFQMDFTCNQNPQKQYKKKTSYSWHSIEAYSGAKSSIFKDFYLLNLIKIKETNCATTKKRV